MRKIVGIVENIVVEIYDRAVEDKEASEKADEKIFKTSVYIKKKVPNSRDAYDQPIKSTDIERYPDLYEKFEQGKELPLNGTPLEECALIGVAEIETLKAKNIFTTQQFIGMPESGMHRLGPGFISLKSKVEKWAAKGRENDELQDQIKALQEQVKQLLTKRKPGRPKKVA